MTFKRRGKVTRENSIFHKNGTVSCPFSTNSYTSDEYFTIDESNFDKVEGRYWYVYDNGKSSGAVYYDIRASKKPQDPNKNKHRATLLHQLMFYSESVEVGLEVDHRLHWTDNRRSSVNFVTAEENKRRGPALYHKGRNVKKAA